LEASAGKEPSSRKLFEPLTRGTAGHLAEASKASASTTTTTSMAQDGEQGPFTAQLDQTLLGEPKRERKLGRRCADALRGADAGHDILGNAKSSLLEKRPMPLKMSSPSGSSNEALPPLNNPATGSSASASQLASAPSPLSRASPAPTSEVSRKPSMDSAFSCEVAIGQDECVDAVGNKDPLRGRCDVTMEVISPKATPSSTPAAHSSTLLSLKKPARESLQSMGSDRSDGSGAEDDYLSGASANSVASRDGALRPGREEDEGSFSGHESFVESEDDEDPWEDN